jgi:hypothetical protein
MKIRNLTLHLIIVDVVLIVAVIVVVTVIPAAVMVMSGS